MDTASPALGAFNDSSDRTQLLEFAARIREEFARLTMEHQFAVDEVLTKVSILQREFLHLHSYNPIEHVSSRVKSAQSIIEKLNRKGFPLDAASARARLTDIAGVRVICSFVGDTYRVMDTLTAQNDLTVVTIKDYIASPKPNGYKSLHAIVTVPVFLSDGPVPMNVEVQIRTIAMDFWASLEHKIYYKYDGEVPDSLVASLTGAARIAAQLDQRMEQLHTAVRGDGLAADHPARAAILDEAMLQRLWTLAQGTAKPATSGEGTPADLAAGPGTMDT